MYCSLTNSFYFQGYIKHFAPSAKTEVVLKTVKEEQGKSESKTKWASNLE